MIDLYYVDIRKISEITGVTLDEVKRVIAAINILEKQSTATRELRQRREDHDL